MNIKRLKDTDKRLTGLDAYGNVISTEEYDIIAQRGMTEKEKIKINERILEKLYDYENREEELKRLTNLFEKTFDWGCNDTARALYANAVYAIISGNEIFEQCIEDFEDSISYN